MTQVNSQMTAQFTASKISGKAPLTIQFVNTSLGSWSSCVWEFDDNETSTIISPEHTFINSGVYNVKLTINDDNNNIDSIILQINVLSNRTIESIKNKLYIFKTIQEDHIGYITSEVQDQLFESTKPFLTSGMEFDYNVIKSGITSGASLSASVTTGKYLFLATGHEFLSDTKAYVTLINSANYDGGGARSWYNTFKNGAKASQSWWYKVLSYSTAPPLPGWASARVNLHRNIPNVPPEAASFDFYTYQFGSGCSDFLMNVIVDKYWEGSGHSAPYSIKKVGTKKMLYSNSELSDHICVIYSTGITTINTATSLYPGTSCIKIPYVLWHEGDYSNSGTVGVILTDNGIEYRHKETGLRYGKLSENVSNKNVGMVLYDLKKYIITDQELCSALILNSNRTYTLKEPSVDLIFPINGDTWTKQNTDYYLTYLPILSGQDANGHYTTSAASILHCKYIQKVTQTGTTPAAIRIEIPQSRWLRETNVDANGYIIKHYNILMATGNSNTLPKSYDWRTVCTGIIPDTGGSSVKAIGIANCYSAGTNYVLPLPNSGSSSFAPGNETMFIGYVSGYTGKISKKLSVACVGTNEEFNKTMNPTWTGTTSAESGSFINESLTQDVYISEVGLYNDDNELLVIGKISKPIQKNKEKFAPIRINIEF